MKTENGLPLLLMSREHMGCSTARVAFTIKLTAAQASGWVNQLLRLRDSYENGLTLN